MSTRSCLSTIKIEYDNLTAKEKKVADYILKNYEIVISMTIAELAEKAGSIKAVNVVLIGVLAKVQESIPEKGYGEIAYVVNGNSYTAPAKTTDGHPIAKGTEVSICWVEQYVFYVVEV